MLLYLEERYELADNKIANVNTFPEVIRKVMEEYKDVFNTKLRKSMNVPLAYSTW